jgi:hypothetical protein
MRFVYLSCAFLFLFLLNHTPTCVAAGDSGQPAQAPGSAQQVGPPGDGVYAITEAGPHERRWAKVNRIQQLDGSLQTVTNSYVELKTGMNVWSAADKKWIEASDEIEIVPGVGGVPAGAVAKKAQLQVIFAPRLLAGADPTIDLLMADGKRLQSRVQGIAYTDTKSGQSIFITEAHDTGAELVGRNQWVYPDAFDGLDGDIRYSMKISSFEQDILVRQQFPFTDELRKAGFSPESTRVEIWTAFVTATPPDRHPIESAGKILEGDEQLDFGPNSMAFGPSQAFSVADSASAQPPLSVLNGPGRRMATEWVVIDGQQFLIESMPFEQAQALTQALPKPQARAGSVERLNRSLMARQGTKRSKPVSLRAEAKPAPSSSSRVAQATRRPWNPKGAAALYDYVLINGATSYRFMGDTTYFVTADASFFGTNTFEGNTIIKFDRYLGNPGVPRIMIYGGSIVCATGPFSPAVFTAKDDDTVGQIIDGSTGNPGTNLYAYTCIGLWNSGPAGYLHDMRFCYAQCGFQSAYRQQVEIRHAQFMNCYIGVAGYQGTLNLRNALCCNNYYGMLGQYSTLTAENVTFDQGTQLAYNASPPSTFSLTNCLVTGFSNTNGYTGSFNQFLASSNGVYQAAGGGGHYLSAGSPYRGAGTTNLYSQLLSDLRSRTTYPLVCSAPSRSQLLSTHKCPEASARPIWGIIMRHWITWPAPSTSIT